MKNRIDTSRQKTPWDLKKRAEISPIQEFVKEKYKWNFQVKHPKLSDTGEDKIINCIKISKCKYCDSSDITKKGFTSNHIQRYYCNKCHRKFTPITNTIFENHKISITEWIEFILDLLNYGSISLISKVNKNAVNTTIYWLHKTFLILINWQNSIILEGEVYIDEFFYKVIKSDIKTKNGKQLRGLSRNQYCIGIGCDKTNIIAKVEGLGKTSTDKTNELFITHIKPGSRLIHDDKKMTK